MHVLKLTRIGDSLGIIIPPETLARLGLESGETLFLDDTPDGLLLSPYDADTREQINVGRELLREHGATLRALSK
ncbi:AbrB/MazE/SpoVT family DNA-binding domain-containing protein [Noviherbaspirillum cavernae]|uniref:AbrB/MazE/SpoVT family DNA-binding domain-containing protein n=1 Tax=Noviherbaspirillum cavernae TaxID=2320862 RepID=A0A418X627_9BURK|nr:AbrB/MazE/SpoVT family DNA-binding domain-containing protein [Noviherbaspirillum cavernae]RJG07928.1 AbrB/MazE/SpoVT family DNA-binding domain-containing protein [Noviherbaspirillum cavernae]